MYYLLEAELYEAYNKKESDSLESGSNIIEELLPNIPKSALKKCRLLMTILTENGINWNKYGIVKRFPTIREPFNIIDFIVYSVTGKSQQPIDFHDFLVFLVNIKVPTSVLSAKIRRQYGKIKKE